MKNSCQVYCCTLKCSFKHTNPIIVYLVSCNNTLGHVSIGGCESIHYISILVRTPICRNIAIVTYSVLSLAFCISHFSTLTCNLATTISHRKWLKPPSFSFWATSLDTFLYKDWHFSPMHVPCSANMPHAVWKINCQPVCGLLKTWMAVMVHKLNATIVSDEGVQIKRE